VAINESYSLSGCS